MKKKLYWVIMNNTQMMQYNTYYPSPSCKQAGLHIVKKLLKINLALIL